MEGVGLRVKNEGWGVKEGGRIIHFMVGPIWVQPIPIYSHSRYFCQYRYISTNISATDTDTDTDIFILADILPITGILVHFSKIA